MDREKSSESQAGETANLTDEDAEIKKTAKQDINEVHLRDKDTLYENDDETSVVTMYLTVSQLFLFLHLHLSDSLFHLPDFRCFFLCP